MVALGLGGRNFRGNDHQSDREACARMCPGFMPKAWHAFGAHLHGFVGALLVSGSTASRACTRTGHLQLRCYACVNFRALMLLFPRLPGIGLADYACHVVPFTDISALYQLILIPASHDPDLYAQIDNLSILIFFCK